MVPTGIGAGERDLNGIVGNLMSPFLPCEHTHTQKRSVTLPTEAAFNTDSAGESHKSKFVTNMPEAWTSNLEIRLQIVPLWNLNLINNLTIRTIGMTNNDHYTVVLVVGWSYTQASRFSPPRH